MTLPRGIRATRSSTERAYAVGATARRLEQRPRVERLGAVDERQPRDRVGLRVGDLLRQRADAVAQGERGDRHGGQHAEGPAAGVEEARAAVPRDPRRHRVDVAGPATGGAAERDAALRAERRDAEPEAGVAVAVD